MLLTGLRGGRDLMNSRMISCALFFNLGGMSPFTWKDIIKLDVGHAWKELNELERVHWLLKLNKCISVLVYSKHRGNGCANLCSKWVFTNEWNPHHDFTQLVTFGANVVHQHFVRCELVFDGQRVVLTLLNLLQLNSVPEISHHLHPEPCLVGDKLDLIR